MERTTHTPTTWAILLLTAFVIAGCGDKKKEPPATPEPAQQQTPAQPPQAQPAPAQPAQAEPAKPEAAPQRPKQEPSPSPAAEPPTIVPEKRKPEPPRSPEAKPAPREEPAPAPAQPTDVKPAPPASPQKPATPSSKPPAAKDVIALTGSPLGGVRLQHTLHAQRAGNTCTPCHHASRPEKPATAPQQACSDCHTKTAAPPMRTKLQAAFHDPMAKSGTCINCHQTQTVQGKKAPLKCQECHKKEIK